MKDEVRKAVKLMKKGKTAGLDKITVEMIESLDEFGIDMLTDFLKPYMTVEKSPLIYQNPSSLPWQRNQEPQNVNHTVQ